MKEKSGLDIKDIITTGLLLGIGAILHYVVSPIYGGIKPDFLLCLMFIAIFLTPNFSNTLLAGGGGAIIAALTTGFPGGQIPSIFDKLISAVFIFILFKFLFFKKKNVVIIGILNFLGTVVSGAIFVMSVIIITGTQLAFLTVMFFMVLPTAIFNTALGVLIFRVFQSKIKDVN